MIMVKNYNPVIVFAFSKRECEALALQMSKLEFNTDDERDMVTNVFTNAISNLSDDDRTLPQIEHILPLLKRGIGIHHGGLLPILKEVIEILFQEGLIKVLFATETFSIGLNMPAKTVVFTTVRKFDGRDFRNLSSGEYIQMSGRAGRRGLDDRGIVIMMTDEKLEPAAAKNMVKGEADRLDSAFHLGYNMILNLMRVEGLTPEYMLERCFYQFQNTASVPQLEDGQSRFVSQPLDSALTYFRSTELRELDLVKASLVIPDEENIADYYELRQQLDILNKDLRDVLNHPTYALPFLQPGRLVRVKHDDLDFGWGCVVNYQKRLGIKVRPFPAFAPGSYSRCPSLAGQASSRDRSSSKPVHRRRPPPLRLGYRSLDSEEGSSRRCDWDSSLPFRRGRRIRRRPRPPRHPRWDQPHSHLPRQGPQAPGGTAAGAQERAGGATKVPRRDRPARPCREHGHRRRCVQEVAPRAFSSFLPPRNVTDELSTQKIEILESRLLANALHNDPKLPALYDQYASKQEVQTKIRTVKKKIQAAHSVMHLDELKCRKRALRRLGFATTEDVVEQKGRVACEISSGDELLLTEMIFNGVFNDLTPEQCAALLSCFVFDEKVRSLLPLFVRRSLTTLDCRASRRASSRTSSLDRCE